MTMMTTPRGSTPPGMVELNPYTRLVNRAKKSPGKRYALTGRYSVRPYEGRRIATEAYAVMGQLHQAAQVADVRISVRRFDNDGETCRIAFRVL